MGNNTSSANHLESGQTFDLGNALDNLAFSEAWSLPKMPEVFGQNDRESEAPSAVDSASRRSASPSSNFEVPDRTSPGLEQPAGRPEGLAQAAARQEDGGHASAAPKIDQSPEVPPARRGTDDGNGPSSSYGFAIASHKQLELLKELSAENKRLQELKNYYTQRLASPLASVEQFELLKQQRSNVVPRLQETDDGIMCEGQINKTLAISLETGSQDKTRQRGYSETMKNVLGAHGISVGMVDKLTVRKCWSTGDGASATSAIRTLGSVKHLTIDDCHKSTILVDGVSSSCTISSCSMLTLVIGGTLPHIHMIKCEKIKILGCISLGRQSDLCMSCCEAIVTCLHQHEDWKSAVAVLEEEDDARVIHMPDTVEAHVESNSVICELENSTSVPDDRLPMTGDTTIEFVLVDQNAEIAAVSLDSHEEHQTLKHRAHKHAKQVKLDRVSTIGSTASFKLRTTGSFVKRSKGSGSRPFEKLSA